MLSIKIKLYKLSLKQRVVHLTLHILALGFALYYFEGLSESVKAAAAITILALVVVDVIIIYRILETLKRK